MKKVRSWVVLGEAVGDYKGTIEFRYVIEAKDKREARDILDYVIDRDEEMAGTTKLIKLLIFRQRKDIWS